MFNGQFWTRVAVLGILATILGCSEQSSTLLNEEGDQSIRPRDAATETQSLEPGASNVIPSSDAPPLYQAAIPELPEFDWADIRPYNLPLNNPPFVRPIKAGFLRGDDIVLGVVLGDEARAYPWNLVANYHAVNDHLNGEPIIVNLCEACNGGAAFLATIPGTVLDMRPRGLKNGTWYGIDFQTGSLWYPFIGEAFSGPLKGTKLTRIRVYFSTWKDWVRGHPFTTVAVTTAEVRMRPHGRASRMAGNATFNPMYLKRITDPKPNPNRDLLPGHTLVFGLIPSEGKKPKAFTIDSLGESSSLIQKNLDGTPILLMLQNLYQVGAYQRMLNGVELDMTITSESPLVMTDQKGNRWDMWGRTTHGSDHPSELALVDGYLAKWYEWVENFPNTELVEAK